MGFLSLVLPSSGGGIAEYGSWDDLPSAPPDGTQALLRGVLVEYSTSGGWSYAASPPPAETQASSSPTRALTALYGRGQPAYMAEPDTSTDSGWSASAWTLVT